ncbi:uncharacterized protein LOC111888129 isoform X1 [Lactuca sativa]|uniref:uncharacterized protein LOC111888129 isoform X1 n=1 Tax=Lactuca sativa TaxID=4236 RepID=UPI0022AEDC04|nr:uncharacterized protein LOC111888129 isoform X1 [Lactuca sativa]XP_052623124.1 uncharacterized protein LOC111888129 isoform X1 [Lactuca sativa]
METQHPPSKIQPCLWPRSLTPFVADLNKLPKWNYDGWSTVQPSGIIQDLIQDLQTYFQKHQEHQEHTLSVLGLLAHFKLPYSSCVCTSLHLSPSTASDTSIQSTHCNPKMKLGSERKREKQLEDREWNKEGKH